MRIESLTFDALPGPNPSPQPLPFLVRHFARRKLNRLAASVRIPVTPANRALLRELRAAEMAAWEQAIPRADNQLVQLEGAR